MYRKLRQNKYLWDHFTRREEYCPIELDKRNKFTYPLAGRKDIMDPIVSRFLVGNGLNIAYPDDKKFAVCLTHDVDDIYPTLAHSVISSLYCIKNFDMVGAKKQIKWKFAGREYSPYRNFKEIIKLEERHNAKSSFYFMTTDRDIIRFRYNIKELENDLSYIAGKGWEVGLHGGYYSYNNFEYINSEKRSLEDLLGNKVIGYRNHYLRFKIPDTWELLAKAGFKYDTTLGYDDMIGFRNGMCHPFKPYNLETEKLIDIFEIPLCIMDVTFLEMKSKLNQSFELAKELINTTEKYGGVLTLLWHNNIFNCPFRASLYKLYEKILDFAYQKGAWMTSGEEILKVYQ
jgi:peptidoglycan/xylan/chitin deacetylase (PgdA/CDA1 family)